MLYLPDTPDSRTNVASAPAAGSARGRADTARSRPRRNRAPRPGRGTGADLPRGRQRREAEATARLPAPPGLAAPPDAQAGRRARPRRLRLGLRSPQVTASRQRTAALDFKSQEPAPRRAGLVRSATASASVFRALPETGRHALASRRPQPTARDPERRRGDTWRLFLSTGPALSRACRSSRDALRSEGGQRQLTPGALAAPRELTKFDPSGPQLSVSGLRSRRVSFSVQSA